MTLVRILGIDPGALRLGWAVVDTNDTALQWKLIDSGILGLPREDKLAHVEYRQRLIQYWYLRFPTLLLNYAPDKIVSEILPAVGGGNFIAATQSELAKACITTCQVVNLSMGNKPWKEMAANSVKKTLTGNGRATKVGVRNAVTTAFPELLPRKKELTVYADEADAIGIALVGAGYHH